MAQAASPAVQLSLLVSDVPDHALDALASGPTMPDSSTVDDCYEIAKRYPMLQRFSCASAQYFRATSNCKKHQSLAIQPSPIVGSQPCCRIRQPLTRQYNVRPLWDLPLRSTTAAMTGTTPTLPTTCSDDCASFVNNHRASA